MKKILSLILAVLLMMSMSATAFAESNTTDRRTGSFELTTTVPTASWILNISAESQIPYGSTETYIGTVSVSNVEGCISGWGMQLHLSWNDYASIYDPGAMRLPIEIVADIYDVETGEFIKRADNPYNENRLSNVILYGQGNTDSFYRRAELYALITEEEWDRVGPDTLSTTVTYEVEYTQLAG